MRARANVMQELGIRGLCPGAQVEQRKKCARAPWFLRGRLPPAIQTLLASSWAKRMAPMSHMNCAADNNAGCIELKAAPLECTATGKKANGGQLAQQQLHHAGIAKGERVGWAQG